MYDHTSYAADRQCFIGLISYYLLTLFLYYYSILTVQSKVFFSDKILSLMLIR